MTVTYVVPQFRIEPRGAAGQPTSGHGDQAVPAGGALPRDRSAVVVGPSSRPGRRACARILKPGRGEANRQAIAPRRPGTDAQDHSGRRKTWSPMKAILFRMVALQPAPDRRGRRLVSPEGRQPRPEAVRDRPESSAPQTDNRGGKNTDDEAPPHQLVPHHQVVLASPASPSRWRSA